jgi:hypothetical protein
LLAEVVANTLVVGVEGNFEVVLDVMEFAPTLGLTVGGDEDQYHEEGVSLSNTKRKRELKTLECSINFEPRGCGSVG